MIIIHFKGGLGNQLFQFAYGKTLAIKKDQPLFFDKSFYETNHSRRFMLDFLDENNSDKIKHLDINDFKLITDGTLIPLGTQDLFLDGYFQEPALFKPIDPHLKQTVREGLIKQVNTDPAWIDTEFKGWSPVAIHLRRADYLTPKNLSIHGICGKNYYKQSIAHISSNVKKPKFFIFSDDAAFADKFFGQLLSEFTNASLYLSQFMSGENTDYAELLLMSRCSHFIIANSSYSWWAAWLSGNKQKIVVAPKKWYKDAAKHKIGDLIYEDNWIKI